AKDVTREGELDDLLVRYVTDAREIARALAPISPALSERAVRQLRGDPNLPAPRPVFDRIQREAGVEGSTDRVRS
ncbi:MAG: hypothetical protein LC808_14455, partial [Actinobacteria bacterium]|nr:hypothetical protein [Actinomycetota bacterium]